MGEEIIANIESQLLQSVEAKEGITDNELSELAGKMNWTQEQLKNALGKLQANDVVEKRQIGGRNSWYPLEKITKKILIVEDDQHINRLIKASVGTGYEVAQSYEGRDAMKQVREFRPDLVVLDLMLPGLNGLEICRTMKVDPELKHIPVVIVSAADATQNRFAGIKFGADFYIKKPFEPKTLKALVSLFLRKKGKKFDPLIDLPDAGTLSQEINEAMAEKGMDIVNLRVSGLAEFSEKHGKKDGDAVVRLVSQLLQDLAREWDAKKGFVGYIGKGEFILGGGRDEVSLITAHAQGEFQRALPFIYQGKRAELGTLDIEDMFGEKFAESSRLNLVYDVVPREKIEAKREEIIGKQKEAVSEGKKEKKEIGQYTLAELTELVGSGNLEVALTRGAHGVELHVSKGKKGEN